VNHSGLRTLALVVLAACGTVNAGDPAQDAGPDADLRQPQTLTVTVTGDGTVTSDPAGIECAPTCSAMFDPLSTVTLTATPAPATLFAGWSGDCSGAETCTVTMDGAKSVQAQFATHGAKRWVDHITFPGQDSIDDIAIDAAGNVYAAGTATPETAGGGDDAYVVKYAPDGTRVWAVSVPTGVGEYSGGIAVDDAGNVYLAFTVLGFGETVIAGKTITADLFGNVVVVRLATADGHVEWAQQWGGNGQDRPNALAVDGTDLYVVGETSSSPGQFGDLPMYMAGTGDVFLVKARTSDGVALAQKVIDSNADVSDVAVGSGHVLVIGEFQTATTVDLRCSLTPQTGASRDGMLLDFLASDLSCQWARDFGDATGSESANAAAAYPGGGWVVTGGFLGNVLFADSGTSLSSRGSYDAFAVRYEADGDHVWSFRYGDVGSESGQGIAVTSDGAVVLSGGYGAEITFGATRLTGTSDMFVTRMSAGSTPVHEWAVSIGGDGVDYAQGVVVDSAGNPYSLAQFSGMTVVGDQQLTASGDMDAYVVGLVR
jgi:hypothetical protein